jgi:AcrR family transcriptional regulator
LTEITDKLKSRIAGAFEKHFRHFGFKKTTVDDVAADLGISKKTIYAQFKSKDEIFYYIISRKAEARKEIIEDQIMHIDSAMGKMEEMIRINFSEFRKVHKRKIKAMDEHFQSEIAAGAFRQAFKQLVSNIIEEGVKKGEFEVSDHDITVRFTQALITEAIHTIREDNSLKPEDILVASVNRLLRKIT